MKCVEIRQNKLNITDIDDPKAKKGEVLIKVNSAGINRADIMQRKGKLDITSTDTHPIPGLEIAGEIIDVSWGANKKRKGRKKVSKGDRVIAIVNSGGYAELCSVPAERCIHIPKKMTFEQASAIGFSFMTAWYNLVNIAKVKKGETVLIHGGSSGFATAAMQLAKALGAKVIVTSSHEGKCKSCEKLGADLAINYKSSDFVKDVMKYTKDVGVDIVLDIVGGEYFAKNIEVLKNRGRYVSLAALHGKSDSLDLNEIINKEISITGSQVTNLSDEEVGKLAEDLYKNVIPLMRKKGFFGKLFGRKTLEPVICKEFPLIDIQQAHDYMDRGLHFGKVIVKIA